MCLPLGMPSEPVDDGEQVRGSTSVWHGNGLWKYVDVYGHLATLTCQTLTCPHSHLLG